MNKLFDVNDMNEVSKCPGDHYREAMQQNEYV